MVDTPRSRADLLALYADNNDGGISEQDLRDGVVSWFGSYGSIYTHGSTVAQSSIGTTYVKITGFTANGASTGVTVDHTNDRLTLSVAGTYLVACSISFSGSVSTIFDLTLFLDSTEANPGLRFTRTLGTGGDTGSAGAQAILSFSSTAELEMHVKADGASKNLTPQEASFMVKQVG